MSKESKNKVVRISDTLDRIGNRLISKSERLAIIPINLPDCEEVCREKQIRKQAGNYPLYSDLGNFCNETGKDFDELKDSLENSVDYDYEEIKEFNGDVFEFINQYNHETEVDKKLTKDLIEDAIKLNEGCLIKEDRSKVPEISDIELLNNFKDEYSQIEKIIMSMLKSPRRVNSPIYLNNDFKEDPNLLSKLSIKVFAKDMEISEEEAEQKLKEIKNMDLELSSSSGISKYSSSLIDEYDGDITELRKVFREPNNSELSGVTENKGDI